MLIGWRARRLRVGALVAGTVAVLVMGVVGCTSIIEGTATVNSSGASSYRVSVSKSVSASLSTSRSRESERQQSLTTQAIRGDCATFASSSGDAVDAVNKWVAAFNSGGDTSGTAGPAITALNSAADTVSGMAGTVAASELRDKFNAYAAAARAVSEAISSNAGPSIYNARKEELNNIRSQTLDLCKAY